MRYLVYSKTTSDNLPLSTTTVNSKPCLDPSEIETHHSAYYPTELGNGKSCGSNTDPRYVSVGEEALLTRYEL